MSASKKQYLGEAQDIGADIFIDMVMPVIRQASHKMNGNQLGELYLGFIGAAFGSLEADFGKESADYIIEQICNSYTSAPPLEKVTTQ